MNGDQRKLGLWDVFERAAKVSSILLVPILLWGIKVEFRLRDIPGEHATMTLEHEKATAEKMAALIIPPDWFRDDVAEIKADVALQGTVLQTLSVQVATLNSKLDALRPMLRGE